MIATYLQGFKISTCISTLPVRTTVPGMSRVLSRAGCGRLWAARSAVASVAGAPFCSPASPALAPLARRTMLLTVLRGCSCRAFGCSLGRERASVDSRGGVSQGARLGLLPSWTLAMGSFCRTLFWILLIKQNRSKTTLRRSEGLDQRINSKLELVLSLANTTAITDRLISQIVFKFPAVCLHS